MSNFDTVNLDHPQQDIHRIRRERTGHVRYRVAEQLLPPLVPGTSVLEIGCGRSEFAQRLRELGAKVTISDLSPTNIEFGRELGFEAYQIDLNQGLPVFPPNHFDGVVILEVIEHVVAAEQLLNEIRRVLKPGGFLLLSTPNFVFLPNRLRILFGKLSRDEGYHYRFFTPQSLARQINTAGLTPQVWRFVMPAFGINLLRRWMGLQGRMHVQVPSWSATLLALTMVVRARKQDTRA